MRQGCGLSLAKASSTRVFVKLATSHVWADVAATRNRVCSTNLPPSLNRTARTRTLRRTTTQTSGKHWLISTIAKDERLMVACSVHVVLAQFDSPRTAWMLAVLASGCDSPGFSFLNAFGHYFYARSDEDHLIPIKRHVHSDARTDDM